MNKQPMVLYMRVDLGGETLTAGGSVAHTFGVLKGFISNGWQVVCVSSAMIESLRVWDKVPVYPLHMPRLCKPLRWKLNCLLSNIFFTWRLAKLCARYPITHLYQRHAPFSMTGIMLASWFRIPLILEYNGSEVWMHKNWDNRTWLSLSWLLERIELRVLRKAHTIVALSQPMVDELVLRGISASKILLQPNGVDADLYDAQTLTEVRAALRAQLGLEQYFVFGFVGTFSPWHGITMLAAMIPEVLAREPNAAFLLVGDGQLKPWLTAVLQAAGVDNKRVIFTGRVAQHEATYYLAVADAFLLPTQPNGDGTMFFGSPIKLFEYMSMAKPIIASDIAQVADVLATIGTLVAPTDTQEFVDAACALMHRSQEERAALGKRARERVLERYTWHAHVGAIIQGAQDSFYESVL